MLSLDSGDDIRFKQMARRPTTTHDAVEIIARVFLTGPKPIQINRRLVTHPITEETSVPGVFIAGDASRDVLLMAVGEDAKAAVAIDRQLLKAGGLLR